MKRKIIQLAGRTYVVSLPAEWIKKYNVKKGSEVDLEESGNKVIVTTSSELVSDKVSVDLTNSLPMTKRILGALYKSGYDEIHATFGSEDERKVIEEVVKDAFIGFEVSYLGKNNVVIRFQPGEFEKKYARRQRSCEIILKVPLTASGYYIGKFITRSINHIWGSRVIELKGIEVLTEDDTKFIFNIFDVDFFEQKKQTLEINLRVALNKYFRDRTIERDESYFGDIVEESDQKKIHADDMPHRSFQAWGINHNGMGDKLIEYYSKLGKMGEAIYDIVGSMFR